VGLDYGKERPEREGSDIPEARLSAGQGIADYINEKVESKN